LKIQTDFSQCQRRKGKYSFANQNKSRDPEIKKRLVLIRQKITQLTKDPLLVRVDIPFTFSRVFESLKQLGIDTSGLEARLKQLGLDQDVRL